MIPKDVLEESVVKPYSQGVLDEDINLGVTRFDRLGRVLGTVQKAERGPQDCIFGDSCKRQKVIPKDVLEEKVWSNRIVKEY
jgi:hypothetical protein